MTCKMLFNSWLELEPFDKVFISFLFIEGKLFSTRIQTLNLFLSFLFSCYTWDSIGY